MSASLSIPRRTVVARSLTVTEHNTVLRVADALIPARGSTPAASTEPDFTQQLSRTLDARSDAFSAITDVLAALESVPSERLFARLKQLDVDDPDTFQALSTVIAGAWLLTPGVRGRIGYRGLKADRAGLEDAADDLTSGLLDPVLAHAEQTPSRWTR